MNDADFQMFDIAKQIQDLAKVNNETYRSGYREGYNAGYRNAIDKALKIIGRPPVSKEQIK